MSGRQITGSQERVPLRARDVVDHPHAGAVLTGNLTAWDAFSTIISSIIGSGIFATPGLVYAQTGSPCASLLAWVMGGVLSFIGSLCYAELATGDVDCGAELAYFQKAFNRHVAFAFVFVSFFALASGSIAIEATVFSRYLLAIFDIDASILNVAIAMGLVVFLGFLNLNGCQQSAMIQKAMVVFKVAAVLLLILGAIFAPAHARQGAKFDNLGTCWQGTVSSTFGMGMLGSLWAYSGFNSICALSEEFSNPQRDLPVGVTCGMIVVTILYVLSNVAYMLIIPANVFKESRSVGYAFAISVGGTVYADLLSLLILMATAGAAHSTIFGSSRVFFAAGRDDLFSDRFKRLNSHGVPSYSIIALCAWSCVLILLGEHLSSLIDYSGVATWFFAGLAAIAMIRLRISTSETFHIPFYPITPLVFATGCFALVISGLVDDFYPSLFVIILITASTLYHRIFHRVRSNVLNLEIH